MSDRDAGSFVSGLVVGAIIGVALGLLFAPQSGEETRELVKEKAADAKEKAGELLEKVKNIRSEQRI